MDSKTDINIKYIHIIYESNDTLSKYYINDLLALNLEYIILYYIL